MNFLKSFMCCYSNPGDEDSFVHRHPEDESDHLEFDLTANPDQVSHVDKNDNNMNPLRHMLDGQHTISNNAQDAYKCTDPDADMYPKPVVNLAKCLNNIDAGRLLYNEVDLCDLKRLGEGCYGTVFEARKKNAGPNQKMLAVKAYIYGLEWSFINAWFDYRWVSFKKEVELLQKFNHPNIIKYVESFQVYCGKDDTEKKFELFALTNDTERRTSSTLLLSGFLMEKIDMSLEQYIERQRIRCLNERQLRQLFIQIGGALQYLAKSNLATHRDLKPQNIGVKCLSETKARLVLLDFGISGTHKQEELDFAENQATNYRLSTDILNLEKMKIRRGFTDCLFDNVPTITGNPFLAETCNFARLLMAAATYDFPWWDFKVLFTNFVTLTKYDDDRLRAIILRMAPMHEDEQVTISWALEQYASRK